MGVLWLPLVILRTHFSICTVEDRGLREFDSERVHRLPDVREPAITVISVTTTTSMGARLSDTLGGASHSLSVASPPGRLAGDRPGQLQSHLGPSR